MTTATWNTGSGNWFAGNNWDEPNPTPPPPLVHHIPRPDEDVVVPDNSGVGTPFTIAYNGTRTINTLGGTGVATLDITGGALTVANGGAFNLMAINVAAGATLAVDASTLVVRGSGDYAGTLAGAGELTLTNGTFDLNAGVAVTVDHWTLTEGNADTIVNLNTDLAYAHAFTLTDISGNNPVLNLNGHTLTLSGTALLDGVMNGPGTVLVTGTADMGAGYGGDTVIGGAVLEFAAGATAVEHRGTNLGDSTTTGTLQIDAGADYTIVEGSGVRGGGLAANAIVNNAGTLAVDGGATGVAASVSAQFTNTGTLTIGSDDSLTLRFGGTNTLGGTITGSGTLILGDGTTALNTANVTVGTLHVNGGNGGAIVTLGTDLNYGGDFIIDGRFDTFDLDGHTLRLSNTATLAEGTIDGAGTLKVTGSANIGDGSNALAVGGNNATGTVVTIENAGVMTQTGGFSLHGTLLNDIGHVYTITAASGIYDQGATIINNGALKVDIAGAAASFIDGTFTNNGRLSIAAGDTLILDGTDTLNGTVSGPGTLDLRFANTTINTSDVTVGAIHINSGNAGLTTTLGTNLTYAGEFILGGQFDILALNGHALTLSGPTTFAGGATIKGLDGATDALVINGTDIDLSASNFSTWTSGTDTITLNGTSGADHLTGSSQIDTINGGGAADILTGGAGNDRLDGGNGGDTLDGGAGNDTLIGGAGNDTYIVDSKSDKITELAGSGNDHVFASASYVLKSGQDIETLATTNAAGTAAIDLTGNGLDNDLTGNAGANRLDGKGGNDIMRGLAGDDSYVVDSAGDQVFEVAGGGNDKVMASTSYALQANQEIEKLATVDAAATTAIDLTGNEFANTLTGNAGANVLNGGLGSDTLLGGLDSDTFVFNTTLGATNVDRLTDFSVADTIDLENAIFSALGTPGGQVLADSEFFIGASAQDADDRIIYNSANGHLLYDADGNGAGAAVLFAKLAPGLALTHDDFFVV